MRLPSFGRKGVCKTWAAVSPFGPDALGELLVDDPFSVGNSSGMGTR